MQEALELIADWQQYAIDFAGLIEQVKNEGHVMVSYIEEFCEAIYELYMELSEEKLCMDEKLNGLREAALR